MREFRRRELYESGEAIHPRWKRALVLSVAAAAGLLAGALLGRLLLP
jgi:hypothetical protein